MFRRRSALVFALALALGVMLPGPADAVDPDVPGDRLVYVDMETSTVTFADSAGDHPDVPSGIRTDGVEASSDGERVVAWASTAQRAGVTTTARITRADGQCATGGIAGNRFSGADWSPDGQLLAWTAWMDDAGVPAGVWVQSTGPFPAPQRILTASGASSPTWHPSQEWIAFESDGDIQRVDRNGANRSIVIGGPADDRKPTISSDGRLIAFLRDGRPHVASTDGSGARQISGDLTADLSWWDADTVVASREPNSDDPGVVLVDLDGDTTRLTSGRHVSAHRSVKRAGAGADGYTQMAADGGLFHHGAACPPAANASTLGRGPYVGAASSPDRETYWFVNTGGKVDAYGNTQRFGEVTVPVAQPLVGITATPSGRGYWLVAGDGGIFSFGDAEFLGSTGAIRLNQPIVGMASTPSGRGYWLVASDGGIFAFGDAAFVGSTGAMRLNAPVFAMASTASGKGYWLFARDGGVFSFGDARFHGSTGALRLNAPVTTVTPAGTGNGYWLFGADGGVFTFGDARFHGSLANVRLAAPIIGGVSRES